jgi:hypothetical protein
MNRLADIASFIAILNTLTLFLNFKKYCNLKQGLPVYNTYQLHVLECTPWAGQE